MGVPSFTVTTVTAVTTKRDIPPLEVTQCCTSCRTIYVCNVVGGYCSETGDGGYCGYRETMERVLEYSASAPCRCSSWSRYRTRPYSTTPCLRV
jgi:hypothetical protein